MKKKLNNEKYEAEKREKKRVTVITRVGEDTKGHDREIYNSLSLYHVYIYI